MVASSPAGLKEGTASDLEVSYHRYGFRLLKVLTAGSQDCMFVDSRVVPRKASAATETEGLGDGGIQHLRLG